MAGSGSAVFGSLLIVALALSGCSGSEGTQGPADVSLDSELFDAGSGGIAGLVTDEELRPVVAAIVVLDGQQETRSDAEGRFTFSKIPPGAHALGVAAEGFEGALVEVNVDAGSVAELRVLLRSLADVEPYHTTVSKAGLIVCSVGYRAPGVPGRYAALCGVLPFLGIDDVDQSLNAFNDVGFSPDVSGVVFETAWESTQILGNRMEMIAFIHDVPLPDPTGDYNSTGYDSGVVGTSPLKDARDRAELDGRLLSNGTSICGDGQCFFEIGHYANADPGAPAGLAVIIFQQYDDLVTVFHGAEFSREFSALPDA